MKDFAAAPAPSSEENYIEKKFRTIEDAVAFVTRHRAVRAWKPLFSEGPVMDTLVTLGYGLYEGQWGFFYTGYEFETEDENSGRIDGFYAFGIGFTLVPVGSARALSNEERGLVWDALEKSGMARVSDRPSSTKRKVRKSSELHLRKRLIRLAHAKPELRGDLLPLVAGNTPKTANRAALGALRGVLQRAEYLKDDIKQGNNADALTQVAGIAGLLHRISLELGDEKLARLFAKAVGWKPLPEPSLRVDQ